MNLAHLLKKVTFNNDITRERRVEVSKGKEFLKHECNWLQKGVLRKSLLDEVTALNAHMSAIKITISLTCIDILIVECNVNL